MYSHKLTQDRPASTVVKPKLPVWPLQIVNKKLQKLISNSIDGSGTETAWLYGSVQAWNKECRHINKTVYTPARCPKFATFNTLSAFHHALVLFFDSMASNIAAIIPLKEYCLSKSREDPFSFTIIKGKQKFICKCQNMKDFISIFDTLSSLNHPSCVFPRYGAAIPTKVTLENLKKRCDFSSSVMVTDGQIKGGALSDVIQYAIIHSGKSSTDNLIVTGLLVYLKEKNKYSEFIDFLSNFVISIAECNLSSTKSSSAWKTRIENFIEQCCRSYTLLSKEQRQELSELSVNISTKREIKEFANVNSQQDDLITVKPMYVAPQWQCVNALSIRNFNPIIIAEQLTYFEMGIHKQLNILELIKGKGSSVDSITIWWNQVSSWVASTILFESNAKAQYAKLKLFLVVAEELKTRRNYSSCSQVINGINHQSVVRLKKLQSLISSKTTKKIKSLEKLFNPEMNYKKYRELPTEKPCLRFLPVYQRDIRFICDSNPLYLDKARTKINIERIEMMGECLSNMGLNYPEKMYLYSIEKDKEFQDFLSQLKKVSDDDLFSLSFASEPSRGADSTPSLRRPIQSFCSETNPLHNSQGLAIMYSKSSENKSPTRQRKRSRMSERVRVIRKDSKDDSSINLISPRNSRPASEWK